MALALVLAQPSSAAAANKEHQQLMAELRMLQEQQQQIHQMLGTLGDALKTLTTRLDEQGNNTRKTFADQKLLIDGVGDTVRVLREKADDTNVRLSTMNQELEAMRQAIASQPQPSLTTPPTGDPAAGSTPGTAPTGTVTPSNPPPLIAPQKLYDNAFADYTAGQYDLAVIGFRNVHQDVAALRAGRRRAAEYRECPVRSRKVQGGRAGAAAGDQRLSAEQQRASRVVQAGTDLRTAQTGGSGA